MDAFETVDLGWIFPNKLESDNRDPLFIFKVPFVDGDFGFFAPSFLFWVELLCLVMMQSLLAAALSTVMYKYIIQKRGKPVSYFVGYGVVIPLCLLFPYYEISALDVRNKILKFCVSSISSTLTMFHCTEAMYGFEPKHVSTSIGAYALYCGSPMELIYDDKTAKHIKSTTKDTLRHLKWFGVFMLLTGVCKSLLLPGNFVPFSSPSVDNDNWYSLSRMFDAPQLKNNMVHALLFQLYLTTFGQGLAANTSLIFGYEPITIMHNPVLESTSPSEFWGKRWNTLIHGVLKRGVFKPFRRFLPKSVAVAMVFLASGLFHEWILTTVYLRHNHELDSDGSCNLPNCFKPPYGGQTGFMLWNAVLVALESIIGGWAIFKWIKGSIPSSLVAMLVVSMGLPVVHWFCEPYTKSDFFFDGMLGFPMVKKLS